MTTESSKGLREAAQALELARDELHEMALAQRNKTVPRNPELTRTAYEAVNASLIALREMLREALAAPDVASDPLGHCQDFKQFLGAIKAHINDYPNLGDCEWNCLTAASLLELVAKVKAEGGERQGADSVRPRRPVCSVHAWHPLKLAAGDKEPQP